MILSPGHRILASLTTSLYRLVHALTPLVGIPFYWPL